MTHDGRNPNRADRDALLRRSVKSVVLFAIGLYRCFISRHKGFHCAYRVCTGCASCSELGYRAVRRFGAVKGLAVLDGRLARCAEAARLMRAPRYRPRAQAGDCDLGCDVGDLGQCVDCGGDCDWRRRRNDPDSRKPGKPPRVPATERRRQREADRHERG